VDVVVSGHTHQEYVCKRNGKLLTSTGFYGSAVTDINLTIVPGTASPPGGQHRAGHQRPQHHGADRLRDPRQGRHHRRRGAVLQ
jgi:hypothetical protein